MSAFAAPADIMGQMHADDMDLVRDFAANGSEAAFATLVGRHVNLVYSAALRRLGNTHEAEEVAQAVFIILAKKAGSLCRGTILSGWLYQTAQLTAANFQRAAWRRQRREQEAFMQFSEQSEPDVSWHRLGPLLEEAMARLGQKERDAVVLRFFKNRTVREVASALGLREDAAQKRVNRAADKLRDYFVRRGIQVSTAALLASIGTHAVQAAPAALAKTITAVAVVKGAAAGGSTLTLVKGALKIMAWTKAKTAIVTGVAVILAAGTTPMVIHHFRTNASIFSWTKELSDADNAGYMQQTGTTPEQAARTFFEACGREDWTEAAKFWPPEMLAKYPPFPDQFKSSYGGLEIVSLGKPFKGKVIEWKNAEYAGVYVPYEIRLKGGEIKKWQLAIRCDNRERHWYWDGGM
jgi:RNA polymerase sigma factor (sigma-70 family)